MRSVVRSWWRLCGGCGDSLKSWISKLWRRSIIRWSIIILLLSGHLTKSRRMPQLAAIITGDVSGIVIIVAPTEVLLLIALISTITLGFWFGRLVLKGGHL